MTASFERKFADKLRVGINFGNVVLASRDPAGNPRGIAVELARELARRLNLTMEMVAYDAAGRMADGAAAGEWDVAFLATDPARAADIDFTEPYLEVGTTYLVRTGSPLQAAADVDREGIRISVSAKSAYDLFLTRNLKHAALVRASGPEASIDLFFERKLDALAGLRPILLDLAARHPDTRVLEGQFMAVQQAIGVPEGRNAAAAWLQEFVREIRTSGFLSRIFEQSGIHGVVLLV